MKQLQFEQVNVCPYCGAPSEEIFSGDEGWSFCTEECGCIEGEKSVYKFQCPVCYELCDEEHCSCEDWKEQLELVKEYGWTIESLYQSAEKDWALNHVLHAPQGYCLMEKSLKQVVEWILVNYVINKE